jgi:hypothetical protein
MDRKIFTANNIWTGTMIGGPLAGGYYLYKNFKAFDDNDWSIAIFTLLVSIVFTIALVIIIPFLPENLPGILIPLLYTGIVHFIVVLTQEKNIKKHISENGKLHGWIKTIVISLICLAITILLFLLPNAFKYYKAKNILEQINSVPQFNTKVISNQYGIQDLYHSENIPKEEIDEFAEILYDVGIFQDKIKVFVYIVKEDDIYIFYINKIFLDQTITDKHMKMRELSGKRIKIRFFDRTLENVGVEVYKNND